MGLIILFTTYLAMPTSWQESFNKFATTRTMENPQYTNHAPLISGCRIVPDTSDSWIKNDRYECVR